MTEALPVTDISLAQIRAARRRQRRLRGHPGGRGAGGHRRAGAGRHAWATHRRRPPAHRGNPGLRPARQGPLRPALDHRVRRAPRCPAGTAPATSGTSTTQGRLWVEGRLGHILTTPARRGDPGGRRAGRRIAWPASGVPPSSAWVRPGPRFRVAVLEPCRRCAAPATAAPELAAAVRAAVAARPGWTWPRCWWCPPCPPTSGTTPRSTAPPWPRWAATSAGRRHGSGRP